MSEVEIADCSEAYKNPSCPYVTQININTACMKQVDKALISLLGKDGTGLNDGVIHRMLLKLDDLEAKNKVSASWLDMIKPIAVSVVITALTTYLLTRFA
jgi:hypothetical protein